MFIDLNQKFGKLRIKESREVSRGSKKKIVWICDCGKEKFISVYQVTSGHTKSCRHCNEISADKISLMKFGKLRVKEPQNILPGSARKIVWICDCGKEKLIEIIDVFSGHVMRCGLCN